MTETPRRENTFKMPADDYVKHNFLITAFEVNNESGLMTEGTELVLMRLGLCAMGPLL